MNRPNKPCSGFMEDTGIPVKYSLLKRSKVIQLEIVNNRIMISLTRLMVHKTKRVEISNL